MPEYDGQQFTPPAPVVRVSIRTLDKARSISNVAMLIDTGADVTLIPYECAERLGLVSNLETSFRLQGFDGKPSAAKAVNAELLFLDKNFHGRFLLVDGDYGILGRNVLNNLSLHLDGPRQSWREMPSGD
jgi:predicted aspartyl protease